MTEKRWREGCVVGSRTRGLVSAEAMLRIMFMRTHSLPRRETGDGWEMEELILLHCGSNGLLLRNWPGNRELVKKGGSCLCVIRLPSEHLQVLYSLFSEPSWVNSSQVSWDVVLHFWELEKSWGGQSKCVSLFHWHWILLLLRGPFPLRMPWSRNYCRELTAQPSKLRTELEII